MKTASKLMQRLTGIAKVNLGLKRKQRRLYYEGAAINRAIPVGTPVRLTPGVTRTTLVPDADGKHSIIRRTIAGKEHGVIDIVNKTIHSLYRHTESVYFVLREGLIEILTSLTALQDRQQWQALAEKLKRGGKLTIASICSGGDILTRAIIDGLSKHVPAQLAYSCEADPAVGSMAVAHSPVWQDNPDAICYHLPLQQMLSQPLPRTDGIVASLPCTSLSSLAEADRRRRMSKARQDKALDDSASQALGEELPALKLALARLAQRNDTTVLAEVTERLERLERMATPNTATKPMDEVEKNSLFMGLYALASQSRPLFVVLENVHAALNDLSMKLLITWMQGLGYQFSYEVRCASDHGAMEQRPRLAALFTLPPISVELQVIPTRPANQVPLNALLQPVPDSAWSDMSKGIARGEAQLAKGNGFEVKQLTGDETRIGCIGAQYWRGYKTCVIVGEQGHRQITPLERARAMGWDEADQAQVIATIEREALGNRDSNGKTRRPRKHSRAGSELVGNAISPPMWRDIGSAIGAAIARTLATFNGQPQLSLAFDG
ncbi:DNA cytosine methyltransferase [Ferrimonas marina]|uniref:Site-specific DNA-cytosine methylase n=1 Tax=Ferrimonas marina TaxID=299255 RepID=A0A1M5TVH8_9GAMM|nr:DNA cytosine methyltransferase [Ferrimonas marina]SHH54596.1 Site-specific DNA-cytosine methylase [Ferrimonas marina]